VSTYTEFEAKFLVASYLVAEELAEQIVDVRDILKKFPLERKPNWIVRAIQSLIDSGYAKGRMHMGPEEDQHVYLSPHGVKEAERLLDEGTVTLRLPEEGDSDETNVPTVVPASDRIVRLDHNDPDLGRAINDAKHLTRQLREGNDVGNLSAEAVAVAVQEVAQIAMSLEAPAVRMPAFQERTVSTLSWIGKEAAGALVGAAALGLLALLASLLGFAF